MFLIFFLSCVGILTILVFISDHYSGPHVKYPRLSMSEQYVDEYMLNLKKH